MKRRLAVVAVLAALAGCAAPDDSLAAEAVIG